MEQPDRIGRKRYHIAALFLLLLSVTAGCDMQPVGLEPTLTPYPTPSEVVKMDVVCADFFAAAARTLASKYRQHYPNVVITVVQRVDTLGYPLLLDGGVDLAFLTWMPDSRSDEIWHQPVVYDGLAVIVHPQNGVPGLTQAQVQKLFQGQVEDWDAYGGLPGVPQLISRESNSGEFIYMQNHLMREIRASLNASLATESTIMRQFVAGDPLAVGYISSAWLNLDIRAVPIDGVPPNSETISAHIYPLTRAVNAVTNGEPVDPARGFIQWILGSEGQTLLQMQGFVKTLE
jgi:phosphate transport system substrate-binding protein